ncbi:MAG TPA: hypothetical protein VFQ24_01720 [Terriglobia bacterium]|nr:hypothetical protein [Terriglobia bacterium]
MKNKKDNADQDSIRTLHDDQIVTERKLPRRSFLATAGTLMAGATAIVTGARAATLVAFPQGQGDPGQQKPGDPDSQKPSDPDSKKPSDPDSKKPSDPDSQKPADPDQQKPADPDSQKPADPDQQKPADPDQKPPNAKKLRG